MKTFEPFALKFSHSKKTFFKTIVTLLSFALLFCFSACQRKIEYFDYVSELRSNIFLAESNELSLRIYAVAKETPYVTDGIKKEISTLTEIYLTAPSGNREYNVSFNVNGRNYGGDMSFDNVKAEYYFSCTLDVSEFSSIECRIDSGSENTTLTATSVLTSSTLTPKTVLKNLQTAESELFSSLTDKYGFAGEIYIRLIYEDSPYYYVGVIDRESHIHAFLINAETGKILARRQS